MIVAAFTVAVLMMQAAPADPSAAGGIPGTRAVSPLTVTPAPTDKVEITKRKLICSDQLVLGTLFHKRMCLTQEEINDRRNVDQAATRQAQALRPYKIDTGALPGT